MSQEKIDRPRGRPKTQSRDPVRATFAHLIHEGMRLQGISFESVFARQYGFSPSSLSQWMGEHREGQLVHISMDNICRLSDALGISAQHMLYALDPTMTGADQPLPIPLEWAVADLQSSPPLPVPGGHLLCTQPIPQRYGQIWRAFHILGEGLKRHIPAVPAGSHVLVRCGPLTPHQLGLIRLPSGERLCGYIHPTGYLQWWEEERGRRISLQKAQLIGTVVQIQHDL